MGIDELVIFPGPVLTTFLLDPRRVMVVDGSGSVSVPSSFVAALPRPPLVID